MSAKHEQAEMDQQLDAMVDAADPSSDDAPASPAAGEASSGAADQDVAGSAFADQVQKILDEAQADLDKADAVAEDADAARAAPLEQADASPPDADNASDASNADDASDASDASDDGDDSQLLAQIDEMLSEQADASVEGDFESVEATMADPAAADAVAAESGPQAADPAPDAADATAADDDVEGDMQSIDDLLNDDDGDDETIRPSDRPLESELDVQSEFEEPESPGGHTVAADELDEVEGEFEAVAAELDDDEALTERVTATAEPDDDPADALPEMAPEPTVEGEAADPEPPPAAEPRRPSSGKLVAVLAKINRPVMNWPAFRRDLLGFIGLETVCVGLCAMVYGVAGALALVVTAGALGPLLVGVFYVLFCRADSGGSARASD